MAKKKTTRKVAKKKKASGILVQKSETPKALFTSTSQLQGTREDASTDVSRKMLMLASKIFEVPVQGVTILGGNPYLNKVGLRFKTEAYYEGFQTTTEFIHYADPREKWAICKATVYDKDMKVIASATGEATPDNIKLAMVKQTLNMMAETRAENRALSKLTAPKMYKDAMQKMTEIAKEQKMTQDQMDSIANAGKVSAEEIDKSEDKAPTTKETMQAQSSYIERVKIQAFKSGAKSELDTLEMINKVTNGGYEHLDDINEDDAKKILPKLMK